ncbi:MAG: hypothetical protein HQK58_01235 [Deltaproteobacteria bacterium]|nr:hypothetical protein [Deltaproteobacteria bacterium]
MKSQRRVIIFGVILCSMWLMAQPAVYAQERESVSRAINQLNQEIQAAGGRWEAGDHPMARLSYDELKSYTGLLLPEGVQPGEESPSLADRAATLPAALDWRNNNGNYVTTPKQQGSCGSCYIFSSVAALESKTLIALKTPGVALDLSEQIPLSCCPTCGNCTQGGYVDYVLGFFKQQGDASDSCLLYTGNDKVTCDKACPNWTAGAYKLAGYTVQVASTNLDTTIAGVKNALNSSGPIIASMAVYEDFPKYSKGVYSYTSGRLLGYHAILIVGYDDSQQALIVKNSWGTAWGESGFFRIAYSQCATTSLTQFAYFTWVLGNAILPASPTPTPTPQNVTLTVSVSPSGAGQITEPVNKTISCTGTCTKQFPKGTTVQLSAQPVAGKTFKDWQGPVASKSGSNATVTMDGDKTITALFDDVKPTLTITLDPINSGTVTGTGGIIVKTSGTYTFTKGAQVTLTATPNQDYLLKGWVGTTSGGAVTTLPVVMDTNQTITVQFAKKGSVTVKTNIATNFSVTEKTAAGTKTTNVVNNTVYSNTQAWPGDYSVTFLPKTGYNLPAPSTLTATLTSGGQLTFTGTYAVQKKANGDDSNEYGDSSVVSIAQECNCPPEYVGLEDCRYTDRNGVLYPASWTCVPADPQGQKMAVMYHWIFGKDNVSDGDISSQWAMLSVNIKPRDPDLRTWLAPLSMFGPAYGTTYTLTNGQVQTYVPNQPDQAPFTLEPGKGYYIELPGSFGQPMPLIVTGEKLSLTNINLTKGLNFVGFNGPLEMPIDSAIQSIAAVCTKVSTLVDGNWLTYVPGGQGNTLLSMTPGEAYLVEVSADAVLSLPENN